jgi:MEKHLA domain
MVASYRRLTGKDLIADSPADMAALRMALWNAPRAIVAHGTEDDPVFFYGNRLALELFEMDFNEFARLPSRFSAEPLAREERARLLDQVTRRGYVDGYCGMRIASSGRRFMIADGTVWNLIDENGIRHGQAAVFVSGISVQAL